MTPKIHGRSGHGGGNPIGSQRFGSGERRPNGNRISRLSDHSIRMPDDDSLRIAYDHSLRIAYNDPE